MLFQKFNPSIRIAANIMHQGGVVAYPTEAVWGLGCDPNNEDAVHRILELKQRHISKGLILVASTMAQFEPYLTHLSDDQRATLTSSWPGPFTWLVPHHNLVPSWVSGKHASIALRVSKHPQVRYLCDAFGGPIVSTSANPQGKPAATHAWQVERYFLHNTPYSKRAHSPELDWVVRGCVGQRKIPSTITDLVTGQVIR